MNKELIIKNMQRLEDSLSIYACKSSEGIRITPEDFDIRTAFFRDIDRIIYSLSYSRYIDKTQVFSFNNNDHISKRMTHVQMVSKIARTIGRALGLNEDLIEAAALGHDLGHTPFGHAGEAILNKIAQENNEGYFHHNIQSVRTLMYLEKNGTGNNLTLQTLDAIMCHNGEFLNNTYQPKPKTWAEFTFEYEKSYQDSEFVKTLIPMTLEGCVVRISDIIGYIGKDIEDAIRIGILEKEKLPKSIVKTLGDNNRSIINTIILDIINNSIGKNSIQMSPDIYHSLKELKDFNYQNIYLKANNQSDLKLYEKMIRYIFTTYLKDLNNNNSESNIYKFYLNHMSKEYRNNSSNARIVIDYIAGMTDEFLTLEYNNKQE